MARGRTILNTEIEYMKNSIIKIVSRIDMSILKLEKSLIDHNMELAGDIVDDDEKINEMCLELEKHAYMVIALQQPVTKDLRSIMSIIRIIPDLERIGDHIKDIARQIPQVQPIYMNDAIEKVAECMSILRERLDESIEIFINEEAENASELAEKDHDIDVMSDEILKLAIHDMEDDTENINSVSKLLLISKNIERAGDYIVNICESTIFLKTGNLVELS